MRILIDCSPLVVGGGVQAGISVIENAYKTKDHEWCLIVSTELRSQISDEIINSFNCHLVLESSSKINLLFSIRKMERFERDCNPDMVYTVFGPSYWRPKSPHIMGFAIPRMIYSYCEWGDKKWYNELFQNAVRLIVNYLKKGKFKLADALIVETEVVKNRLSNYLKYPRDNIYIVPNTYSPIFLQNIKKCNSNKVNISNDDGKTFQILIPSSYYPHKNLEIIPRVAAEIIKRFKKEFIFKFTLPQKSNGWNRIHHLSEKFGVTSYIENYGSVNHADIAKCYSESNAVFLPTLLECSSAVYPESFMAGLPLITSDRDFSRNLCGRAALFVPPNDPIECAIGLINVMDNVSLREELISIGKERLASYPSPEIKWEIQIKHLAAFSRVIKK